MEIIYMHPWWTTLWIVLIFGFLSEMGKKTIYVEVEREGEKLNDDKH